MNALEPGAWYHIYNHAVGQDNLFRSEENYNYFLRRFVHYIQPVAQTYAYCLMPNHFHILLKIREEKELIIKYNLEGLKDLQGLKTRIIQPFSNFFNSYSKSYNQYYVRRGALFCHNFKRKQIPNDRLLMVIEYIHRNPVHHKFCNAIQDWQWSSYMDCLSTQQTFIERNEILNLYNGKKKFIKSHQVNLENYYECLEEDF